MYKKVMTYTDFDGNERTETIRCNLTKAELTNMFSSEVGGLEKKLTTILEKKDIPQIMASFDAILERAYGEMTPDGRSFVKDNGRRFQAFKETQLYSDFYMLLLSDDEESAAFINGILPEGLREEMAAKGPAALPANPS